MGRGAVLYIMLDPILMKLMGEYAIEGALSQPYYLNKNRRIRVICRVGFFPSGSFTANSSIPAASITAAATTVFSS